MGRSPPDSNAPASEGALADQTPTQLWRGQLQAPMKGAVIANKYKLERLVAKGGMGSVWRAKDIVLGRDLAIKFMDPEIASNKTLRKRFDREARSAAKLRTPHVVDVFEHGVADEVPYIVMELLQGEDLQRKLRRERRVPLRETAAIARHIAKGLRAAHEEGIIHRDLKPQNIFLARNDDEVTAKILDFGVAKVLGPQDAGEGTKTGVVVGSPHYMSPEQARGLPTFDHRSDLWSLAVILFKMVTGHRPFKGDVAGDVIVKICADPIPVPSEIRPNLVPEVDAFFAKALERDPNKRYQSAMAMADAFDKMVAAQLSSGGPRAAEVVMSDPAPSLDPGTPAADAPTPASPPESTVEDPPTDSPSSIDRTQPLGTAANLGEADDDAVDDDAEDHSDEETAGMPLATPITGATDPTGGTLVTGPTGSLRPSELLTLDAEGQQAGTRNVALFGGLAAAALVLLLLFAFAITAEAPESTKVTPSEPAVASPAVPDKPRVVLPPDLDEPSSASAAPASTETVDAGSSVKDEKKDEKKDAPKKVAPPKPRIPRRPPSSSNDWGY